MTTLDTLRAAVADGFARRVAPTERLAESADRIAAACFAMADRFHHGGRLLVFGTGASATDAQHVSVEFVHPVIVGKRALPAFSLVADVATVTGVACGGGVDEVFAHQLRVLGRPEDIALGVAGDGDCRAVRRGLETAHAMGMLTVALVGDGVPTADGDRRVDHSLPVATADPRLAKENHVTLYHLLWELVHVYLDQPSVLSVGPGAVTTAPVDDAAATEGIIGLYPFLYSDKSDLPALHAAVAASIRTKVAEIVALRRLVGCEQGDRVATCARDLAEAFVGGGTLFAFGNGGSSTDAQDIVHTFLDPGPGPGAVPLPALALTADAAVVTALSNDIGFEVVFARQLRAGGGPGDIAVGVSTSGGSANVLAGLAEARQMGMVTVGLAGYGGGRMAGSEAAGALDHLFAMPSSSVHRVQEVQTTLYHVLWETVQAALSLRRPPDPGPRTPPPVRD